MRRGMKRHWYGRALGLVAALIATTMGVQAQAKTEKVYYAQLMVDDAIFRNEGLLSAHIYAVTPGATALTLIGTSKGTAGSAADTAVQAVAKSGKETFKANGAEYQALMPLLDATEKQVGVLALNFRKDDGAREQKYMEKAYKIRGNLQLIVPAIATLFDPYTKGYDETDNLAQKVNQILLARHPDINVVAIHITKEGDKDNKLWGINRPNFLDRVSDEIDHDTERTGRIVMQVIPKTHRMEVHMPLLNRSGKLIGTLCTVYFWYDVRESADLYARSLGIMEEARLLMPDNRADLFKP